MRLQALLLPVAAASLVVGLAGCSGTTQFAGAQPFAIAATPAAPPPVQEAKAPPRVELRDDKIDFKEKIQFEVNKAVVKEESFSLLHEIAEVIRKNPQVKRVSIEGHASAEGGAALNKALSDARAKAVREYLVAKEKIDASRLGSKGWGVEKPIASNESDEGREKNRRVEFLVVEQDVTQKKVEIDAASGKEKVVEEKKSTLKIHDEPKPESAAAKPAEKK